MAFKMPKITIDPSALRQGIWGNTWKQWGWIALAFLALYSVLAGYLTGMLFAAKGIRQDNYRTMTVKYFGPFDRSLFTAPIAYFPAIRPGAPKDPNFFNRPDGCTAQQASSSLPGFPDETISKPDGILACRGDQWRWTIYPWIRDTRALGQFPGCANAAGSATTGYAYLSSATSPAASDAADSTQAVRDAWVCQNDVSATAQF